jgi:hypothetical protein
MPRRPDAKRFAGNGNHSADHQTALGRFGEPEHDDSGSKPDRHTEARDSTQPAHF